MKALTGKAKEAFKAYIKKENGWTSEDFKNHYKCQGYDKYTLADIISWLDSVSLIIEIGIGRSEDLIGFDICIWEDRFKTFQLDATIYPTRQQATEKAIERAVELFNERSEKG